MKVIACVSDGGGMLFAGRRVSSDAVLISDVERLVGESVLFVSDYSAPLFEGGALSTVCASDPLACADNEDFVFLEAAGLEAYKEKVDTLVIYRWNRKYPFDVKLDFDPSSAGMRLCEVVEFSGKAHPKITRERWER